MSSLSSSLGSSWVAGGQSVLAFRVPLPSDLDSQDSCWVEFIPGEGEWKGHPDGAFDITEATIDEMVSNFDKLQTPLKVDYEHASQNPEVLARGDAIPSSGHIHALEKRHGEAGAQLWGFVRWTPRAAEMIRGREYQFNSPVIAFRYPDRETKKNQGATLLSVALTDEPFFQGQQPIALKFSSRFQMADAMDEEKPPPPEDKPPEEDAVAAAAEGADSEEQASPDAFVSALSGATGLSPDQVLGGLIGMQDEIAQILGQGADREEAVMPMSSNDVEKRERQLRLKEAAIEKRQQEVEADLAKLKAAEEKRSADEQKAKAERIAAKASELIGEGYYPDRPEVRKDLEAELTEDFDRTVRLTVARGKHVPSPEAGDENESDVDPEKVTLKDLTDQEQHLVMSFKAARICGGNEQKCIQRVVAMRGQ